MAETVFFANSSEIATLTNTFLLANVATDPTAVSCIITDPTGTQTTHTYQGASPADITKVATGEYQLQVACATVGLWSYVWIGTGAVSDAQAGTFTVQPTTLSQFYCSVEELKSRLGITDTSSDFELQLAVQSASNAVNDHCGRFFYQLSETRTFIPLNGIYQLQLPDLVSVTTFKVDRDGDGTYEETWTQGTDYDLLVSMDGYNINESGQARPYRWVRVATVSGTGGKLLPFVWPMSHMNRVQIAGVWGWPAVPYAVKQASLQLAADHFKLKDSPFGIAGSSEFGMIRVRPNSVAADLLAPYRDSKRKVGV